MIWVLLQSESPRQCYNNAITFFFIFVFFCTRSFFKRNHLSEFVLAELAIIASIMAKFEQIL